MTVIQLHPHPTREDLDAYVTGGLDDREARALERHALVCPACSEALAREAAFEDALYEVVVRRGRVSASAQAAALAPALAPAVRVRAVARGAHRRARFAATIAAAVAMAASVLLCVSSAPAEEAQHASAPAATAAAFAEGAGAQMAPVHPLDGG